MFVLPGKNVISKEFLMVITQKPEKSSPRKKKRGIKKIISNDKLKEELDRQGRKKYCLE